LRLRKIFRFEEQRVTVDYELELLGGPDWEGWFSSEMHVQHPVPSALVVREPADAGVTGTLVVHDQAQKQIHSWSWSAQAQLASLSGPIRPRWWLILHPGETWKCRVSLELKEEA
jgi:hypothetical protein